MPDDRPSILAGLLRILVGLGCIAGGVSLISRHEARSANLAGWDLPSTSTAVYAYGALAIIVGVLLLFGLLPRFGYLVLLVAAIFAAFKIGRPEGGFYMAAPVAVAVVALIGFIAGGGRWALIDRIDPPKPRHLVRDTVM